MKIVEGYKKQVLNGYSIEKIAALELLQTKQINYLIEASLEIKKRFLNSQMFFCSVINAKSGLCSENCKYCAQSSHYNGGSDIYPLLDYDKIRETALFCTENGINRLSLVTSGRDQVKDFDKVLSFYKRLHAEFPRLILCGSLGFIDYNMGRALKEAGVTCYHHNLETSQNNFPSICTTHSYNNKIDTILTADKSGLNVCTGGIFGMNESDEDIVDLFFAIKELPVKSVPINFLKPIKGTPFENIDLITTDRALHILSVASFILPEKNIILAGGRYNTKIDEAVVFKTGISGCITGNLLTTQGSDIKRDKKLVEMKP